MERAAEVAAEHQEQGETREYFPAMVDGKPRRRTVPLGEAFVAQLMRHGLRLRLEKIVCQQRNEGHGDKTRCNEGTCDRHGQAVDVASDVTGQQEEREVGRDVGDWCVKNCSGKFRRAEPGCHIPAISVRQFPLDCVAGHNRIIYSSPSAIMSDAIDIC